MEYLNSYADSRLVASCIYCGARTETRDHCPSRILLDEPYPENLPVVPACLACNLSFSLDEEYFACVVECARTGSIETVRRPKIARLLRERPSLAAMISGSRSTDDEKNIVFQADMQRARNIVLKLARGHAAHEANEILRHTPSHFMMTPLSSLDPAARQHFETVPASAIWPEVGSRAMQRLIIRGKDVTEGGWIEVQPANYRYFVVAEGPVMVRFVLTEYLACEVIWDYE